MAQINEYILTIDVGTTNCKSTLFSLEGGIADQSIDSYPTYYPGPGRVEQDPEEWWAAVIKTVKELVQRQRSTNLNLAAISVTGQMHGVVALGKDDQVLGPCLTLRDQRSTVEVVEILTSLEAEKVYHLTGGRLDPSAPIAKLLWLKKHHPSLFDRVQVFLPPKDYIRYRLSGRFATDPIDASGMLLFDLHRGDWAAPLLMAIGIPLAKLPPISSSSALAGRLNSAVAAQLGLSAGVPVVVGAGDDVVALGAGVIEPGMCLEHLGTTGSIMICTDQIVLDPQMRLDVYPHVETGRWFLGGSTSNAGGALAWATEILYEDESRRELNLPDKAYPQVNNPLVFLPYLNGERCPIWDANARGVFFGLNHNHTRNDLIQAVFEGIAFSLNHILEAILDAGLSPKGIVVTGTFARDPAWASLRANVYGKALLFPQSSEPTALGAMILAGVGIGLFANVAEGVRRTITIEKSINPKGELIAPYIQLYSLYKDIYQRNRPLFPKLATMSCP
ncbi:MAG: FGGY family carbohydrate kinase [Chloroflexi bacterium]|nr:FGGY family carbohydrate kinase [Chloroflexota bacterium]MCL5076008.1 FGGY family carbohydrate kinase [Chloroflexota bacterium]